MTFTNIAPKIPIRNFKRTKIIATLGPASDSPEVIEQMILEGANAIRLNFSHGTHEERDRQIPLIRKISQKLGKPVAIIQDLQGPKMRLGDFDGIVNVRAGQTLQLKYKADYERSGILPIQFDISKKVKRGERLFLFDGRIRSVITSVKDGIVHVLIENDGILIKRKGMNLPDTDLEGEIITPKDKEDIAYGSGKDIDYVALSFVQTAHDIMRLRRKLENLGSKAKIIAKIETNAAVENIEEIVQESDAIMIARGDLAIETLPESVPVVQRKIIGLGLKYRTPTIVATQMLASMTDTPEPTRAEVSDVATAVIVGADCVMLSDETANGKYPVEAIKVMKRVILYTQNSDVLTVQFTDDLKPTMQTAISDALLSLAKKLHAQAIVAESKSGATILNIAALRPKTPLIAVTPDVRVANQLSIVHGTKSYVRPSNKLAATKLTNWLKEKKVLAKGDLVVTVSGKHPGVVGATDTIKVRVIS